MYTQLIGHWDESPRLSVVQRSQENKTNINKKKEQHKLTCHKKVFSHQCGCLSQQEPPADRKTQLCPFSSFWSSCLVEVSSAAPLKSKMNCFTQRSSASFGAFCAFWKRNTDKCADGANCNKAQPSSGRLGELRLAARHAAAWAKSH